MARIIGCITTSHVPAIGKAIAKGQQEDPYWKEWFDGFKPVHGWLAEARPDVAVIVYNDHGLNFFLDKIPTFAIGAAAEYQSADEGWNIPTVLPFKGDPALSWHLIDSVVATSTGEAALSAETKEALAGLAEDVTIKVFTTPT